LREPKPARRRTWRRGGGPKAEEKAERIVQEELGRLGWSGQDLAGRPKGDARKVRIAARLRQETTMTLAWIARRLQMGAPGHVSC
jgi:hypothetical protein